MQVFDASSMIYAWDNYPPRQFPGLWEWMAAQIEAKTLVMPRVGFDEVANKTPDCSQWLMEHGLELLEVTNAIAQDAMRIKGLLGINNDRYHPDGVGENDLLIIATARAQGAELVSDERKQATLPQNPTRRKMPAVCSLQLVKVPCVCFVEHMKRSNEVFR